MNTEDEKVHRVRFVGLDQQRAQRLVELDAQALWTRDQEDVKKHDAAYVELGLDLTPAVMLLYAHFAAEHHARTGRGFWWTPEVAWLEALADAGQSEPLKEFILRRRVISVATRHAELIGMRALAEIAWQTARKSDGPKRATTPMKDALAAFRLCGDVKGMKFVLHTAIDWGDTALAAEAAAARGRTLTKREKLAICRRVIGSDYDNRDKIKILEEHGFAQKLGHELIKDAMRRSGFPSALWHNFEDLCRALGRKPERFMGRWFLAQRGNDFSRVHVAEELLKRRSLFWRDAVRDVLRGIRTNLLRDGNYQDADRVGTLVAESLTVDELMEIVNLGHGELRPPDVEERYQFAKALLAKRLTAPSDATV